MKPVVFGKILYLGYMYINIYENIFQQAYVVGFLYLFLS